MEAEGKPSQVSDIGWSAGSATESCGMPAPNGETVLLGGFKESGGEEGVLVLDAYLEEITHSPRVETFEFGPGGSVTGCPKASLSAPRMILGEDQNAHEAPTGETVILSSELKGADAKSVEWQFKYKNPKTSEEGTETAKQTGGEFQTPAGYEFQPLEYQFKHAGNYEVTEIAKADDLAGEEVKAAEVLKITVVETKPVVTESPVSTKVVEGSSAKFKAAATGATSVQWQVKKGGGAFENDTTDAGVTTDELTVEHTTGSESGYQYRAEFKNGAGETPTTAATLTVETKPVVTESPASTKVVEGGSAKFKAAATGATSVQWQVKKGGGAFENDTTDAGVTTDELTVEHTTGSESGYQYRAEFKNGAGETPTAAATLTVEAAAKAPVVTESPASTKVVEGSSAKFKAAATGATSVQWQVKKGGGAFENDTTDAGVTSDELTVEHTTTSESGYQYRAEFKNGAGETPTTAATLTVEAAPKHENEEKPQAKENPEAKEKQEAKERQEAKEKQEAEEKAKGEAKGGVASYIASLAGTSFSVAGSGAVTLKVSCPSGAAQCTGSVTLRTLTAVSAKTHARRKAILTLASASFVVGGGQTKVLTLHLSATARSLLQRSGTLRVRAAVLSHEPSGASHSAQLVLTLRLVKPAAHKKH